MTNTNKKALEIKDTKDIMYDNYKIHHMKLGPDIKPKEHDKKKWVSYKDYLTTKAEQEKERKILYKGMSEKNFKLWCIDKDKIKEQEKEIEEIKVNESKFAQALIEERDKLFYETKQLHTKLKEKDKEIFKDLKIEKVIESWEGHIKNNTNCEDCKDEGVMCPVNTFFVKLKKHLRG